VGGTVVRDQHLGPAGWLWASHPREQFVENRNGAVKANQAWRGDVDVWGMPRRCGAESWEGEETERHGRALSYPQ